MDYDYWLRIARAGGTFHYTDDVLAASRCYPATKTVSGRIPMYLESIDVCHRHAGRVTTGPFRGLWMHRAETAAPLAPPVPPAPPAAPLGRPLPPLALPPDPRCPPDTIHSPSPTRGPDPMTKSTGRTVPLSPGRRFICDMMHFGQRIPAIPIEKRMCLAPVVAARAVLAAKPGWCAILLKAYATAAAAMPELRRMYMPFPWARLYEHHKNVASLSVERFVDGEPVVLIAKIRAPEEVPLPVLQQAITALKTSPVDHIPSFRRILKISRLPAFLRRPLWSWGLYTSGPRRAAYAGTFGLSTVAGFGSSLQRLISPAATVLTYSPIDEHGHLNICVTFDHRVIDGAVAARALAAMEQALLGPLRHELTNLAATPRKAAG